MPLIVGSPAENQLGKRVTQVVAGFLRLQPEAIDPSRPLVLYGLDSLTSVELVASLEKAFHRSLPDWLLEEYPDVNHLALALGSDDIGLWPSDAEDELDLMLSDSVLPSNIQPASILPAIDQCRHVLLTGASGFLGAYLLRSLLEETEADVYCLVRADRCNAAERIRHNLERYGLWTASFADGIISNRIHPIRGDLTQPGLGLPAAEYETLCRKLDSIYHAGADVNWVAPYSALRRANVFGTRELIRLACECRPKIFHFISSLSVAYAVGGPLKVKEDDDMLLFADRLPLPYAQSKCVAEALVRQAVARGLSAYIHRPALIAGDSRTGVSNLDDILAALFKGCIQMGAAPDLDWALDVLPVDHVARAIIRLPAAAGPGLHTFHLSNPRPRSWRECVLWMNLFGYPLTLLPYQRWKDQLARDAASPDHALHRLRGFFLQCHPDGATTPELYQDGRHSDADCARTHQAEIDLGLNCRPVNAELLDHYFSYYVDQGFLPEPKRRWSSVPRQSDIAACFERPGFFEPLLRHYFGDDSLRVSEAILLTTGSDHSIIADLTSWRYGRRTGLFHYRLALEQNNTRRELDIMVKAKPSDDQVIDVAETVAGLCDPHLAEVIHVFRDRIGTKGGHLRELAIYEEADTTLRRYMPACFGAWRNHAAGAWGLALEHLEEVVLMDSDDDPGAWSSTHVESAISGLAAIHASWYGREAELRERPWIGHIPSRTAIVEMMPLWQALAAHASPFFEEWAGPSLTETHRNLLESMSEWWQPMESGPRTLIHNDFNSRNVALRRDGAGSLLCAYDWELATVGIPQHDLAEFLCFVLEPDVSEQKATRYLEFHRIALAQATGQTISSARWREGFQSALADLLVNRFSFYAMIHRVRPQRFLPRVVCTWQRLNTIFA